MKLWIGNVRDCILHEMQNVFSTQFSQSRAVAFPRWFKRKKNTTPHPPPYLKSPHISGVSCRLQTILVALQEKLQEEPAEVNKRTHVVRISNDETMKEMPCLIICHSGNTHKKKTQTVKGDVHYFFSPQDGGRTSARRYEL